MTLRLLSLSAVVPLLIGTLHAQTPDAAKIIEAARMSATLQHNDLTGYMKTKDGRKTDVALFLKGKDIQFQFSQGGGPWTIFHMRLSDASYDLFEMVDGKTKRFPNEKLTQQIAGTDLTYEDLSFRFFYWPKPTYEGKESAKGRSCHKIRLTRPEGAGGKYAVVYVWVDEKYGAFMQVRGYDRKSTLLKEFSVEDVMKISDGSYTIKHMQVASYDSAGQRRAGMTDLYFEEPKKPAPKGLQ